MRDEPRLTRGKSNDQKSRGSLRFVSLSLSSRPPWSRVPWFLHSYACGSVTHSLTTPRSERSVTRAVGSERREGTELDHESGAFRILLIPAFLSQLFL